MTREEAIEIFEQKGWWIAQKETFTSKQAEEIIKLNDAVNFALSALRPVSREQVETAWKGCKYCDEEWGTCNPITNRFTMPPRGGIRFCPMCGRPLTDEAVQMVMERMEEMKNG